MDLLETDFPGNVNSYGRPGRSVRRLTDSVTFSLVTAASKRLMV